MIYCSSPFTICHGNYPADNISLCSTVPNKLWTLNNQTDFTTPSQRSNPPIVVSFECTLLTTVEVNGVSPGRPFQDRISHPVVSGCVVQLISLSLSPPSSTAHQTTWACPRLMLQSFVTHPRTQLDSRLGNGYVENTCWLPRLPLATYHFTHSCEVGWILCRWWWSG